MPETIQRIAYYHVKIPDRHGEAARVLSDLRERGINLLAFHGFPEAGGSQLDFVPEDEKEFLAAINEAGLEPSERKILFLIQGADRPGICADLSQRLAEAKINITAMDAVVAGNERYGALLWVRPEDIEKAARALGAR